MTFVCCADGYEINALVVFKPICPWGLTVLIWHCLYELGCILFGIRGTPRPYKPDDYVVSARRHGRYQRVTTRHLVAVVRVREVSACDDAIFGCAAGGDGVAFERVAAFLSRAGHGVATVLEYVKGASA